MGNIKLRYLNETQHINYDQDDELTTVMHEDDLLARNSIQSSHQILQSDLKYFPTKSVI